MKTLPVSLALILALTMAIQPSFAQSVSDPENVTYMQATAVQSGRLVLVAQSGLATAEDLTLWIYVPQNDSRQESHITRVIGPDSYTVVTDPYGNSQVKLYWKKPRIDRDVDYIVEASVEATSGSSGQSRDFPVTDVIEADSEIIEAAYTAAGDASGIEGALLMAAWVNENIRYDLSCEDRAYSAKWVFGEKRGTCDEFSNLHLSMLRATGYDAWYVAGYAYLGGRQEGASSFGSHAWVEARIDGKTYSIDPTWAESPVDATHITFARLPDSNFTEHTSVRSRDLSLSWEKDETRITLDSSRESPRIEAALEAFPPEVYGGKTAAVIARISADGCVLTSARFSSCVNEDGSSMLSVDGASAPVVICGEKEMYGIAGTDGIRRGIKYTCPIIFSGGGAREKVSLSITSEPSDDLSVLLSTKNLLTPGQEFTATAALSGRDPAKTVRVIAFMAGEMEEAQAYTGRGEPVSLDFTFNAPRIPGEYGIAVLTSTGDERTEEITVITSRSMGISGIEYPSSYTQGGECTVDATFSNTGDADDATVAFTIGDDTARESLRLEEQGNASASFNCSGLDIGRHAISISLLNGDGDYQDSWTGDIEVAAGTSSIKQGVAGFLEDIISRIIEMLQSLFSAA